MPGIQESRGYIIIKEMMAAQDRQPFLFQEKTWQHINLTPSRFRWSGTPPPLSWRRGGEGYSNFETDDGVRWYSEWWLICSMPVLEEPKGYHIIYDWLAAKGKEPFAFQKETWQHIINGESGLVNAPTGCGKTYSVFLGAIIDFINHHLDDYKKN